MSTGINIAPSSDLVVGTTAVTSGTDGRVFFQAGGVVQQDANFTFDNTLKRLTLKAVGATASDIPFVVQNSASTATPLYVRGTGNVEINPTTSGAGTLVKFTYDANGASNVTYGTPSGLVWHNFYTPYVYSALDGHNGYEGRIDLGRYNGTVRTRLACTGDSFFQFSNLVIGAQTAGARLDVRAQGALSTDIAFRIRNSADTANIVTVNGAGVFIGSGIAGAGQGHLLNMRLGAATASPFAYFDNNVYNFDVDKVCNVKLGFGLIAANSTQSIALGLGSVPYSRNYQQTVGFWTAISQGTNDSGFAMSGADTAGNNAIYTNYYGRNIVLGGTTQGTGTRKIVLNNGTVPSTNLTDAFQQYSADITAGNAAPHFRTENGAIVKVYQETTGVAAAAFVANTSGIVDDTATFGGYTMGQVVAALKAQGLLA